jgi:hypothetical protein
MKNLYKTIAVLILLCSWSFLTFAGDGNLASGSRSSAVGGASSTYSDLWAAFNNQAGLGKIKNISVGITNEFRFLIPELNVRGFSFVLPTKKSGVFALSMSYFGYSIYNEKKIGLAYSKAFGEKVSAGVQIDYLSTHLAESYGNRNAFTVEAGIQATVIKNLIIAAHVFNPTRAKLAEYNDERIPTTLKIGIGYTISEKVIISAESEKNLEEKNIVKAGVEYHIVKQLYLRTGISTNPGLYSFGFGLNLDQLKIDMASTYHPVLGFSPQLSLAYSFR